MSEKKETNRSDLVRLRREQDSHKRVERAKKTVTRTAPPVTSRVKQQSTRSKRRTAGSETRRSTRRRFQVALLPVAPDTELRGISIARPHLGRRMFSFFVAALLGTALYFAFNLPQLQVTQAQVVGNQMLHPRKLIPH